MIEPRGLQTQGTARVRPGGGREPGVWQRAKEHSRMELVMEGEWRVGLPEEVRSEADRGPL